MNKYHYRTYFISKLINVYTIFLAIVVSHVSCSLSIYFKIHKSIQPLHEIIEGYSL